MTRGPRRGASKAVAICLDRRVSTAERPDDVAALKAPLAPRRGPRSRRPRRRSPSVRRRSPIAEEALRHIGAPHAVEKAVRGGAPEIRLAARRARSEPIVAALKPWLEAQRQALRTYNAYLHRIEVMTLDHLRRIAERVVGYLERLAPRHR